MVTPIRSADCAEIALKPTAKVTALNIVFFIKCSLIGLENRYSYRYLAYGLASHDKDSRKCVTRL